MGVGVARYVLHVLQVVYIATRQPRGGVLVRLVLLQYACSRHLSLLSFLLKQTPRPYTQTSRSQQAQVEEEEEVVEEEEEEEEAAPARPASPLAGLFGGAAKPAAAPPAAKEPTPAPVSVVVWCPSAVEMGLLGVLTHFVSWSVVRSTLYHGRLVETDSCVVLLFLLPVALAAACCHCCCCCVSVSPNNQPQPQAAKKAEAPAAPAKPASPFAGLFGGSQTIQVCVCLCCLEGLGRE